MREGEGEGGREEGRAERVQELGPGVEREEEGGIERGRGGEKGRGRG